MRNNVFADWLNNIHSYENEITFVIWVYPFLIPTISWPGKLHPGPWSMSLANYLDEDRYLELRTFYILNLFAIRKILYPGISCPLILNFLTNIEGNIVTNYLEEYFFRNIPRAESHISKLEQVWDFTRNRLWMMLLVGPTYLITYQEFTLLPNTIKSKLETTSLTSVKSDIIIFIRE